MRLTSVAQIRISLYILSILGPTLSHFLRSSELSRAFQSSLGVTGLGLFLTTVVYTARNSIDLFHAICVFHLLGLAGITISPKGHYRSGAARTTIFVTAYMIVAIGYLVWLIYVFATAPTFGEHPECNQQIIYVIFGANIGFTIATLRWLFVAIFASLLIWTCFSQVLVVYYGVSRGLREGSDEKPRGFPPSLLGHWAASAYIICMLELIIQRNSLAPGIGLWTFGQVLAMAMLIGPLIELVGAITGNVEGDLDGLEEHEMM